jgi:hypothetical protein
MIKNSESVKLTEELCTKLEAPLKLIVSLTELRDTLLRDALSSTSFSAKSVTFDWSWSVLFSDSVT